MEVLLVATFTALMPSNRMEDRSDPAGISVMFVNGWRYVISTASGSVAAAGAAARKIVPTAATAAILNVSFCIA